MNSGFITSSGAAAELAIGQPLSSVTSTKYSHSSKLVADATAPGPKTDPVPDLNHS